MTLRTVIRAALNAKLTGSADFATPEFQLPFDADIELTNGIGNDQADVMWSDQRTLSASADEDIDLSGALETALGGSAVFAKVKALLVRASADNANDVVIGPASSGDGWDGPFGGTNPTVSIPPGGAALFVAPKTGWTVSGSAPKRDLLNVANGGAGSSVTYDIKIVGTSA